MTNRPISEIFPAGSSSLVPLTVNYRLMTENCFFRLSPIIPALTGTPPVTPIIPALTQIPGGGGHTTPFSCATGNCCPTSRTISNMYHYIKYQCRRADNFGVRRLAAAFTVDAVALMNCLGEADYIAKAGASSRTPKLPWMEEAMSEKGQKENR